MKTFHIVTYGCQMNVYDSGHLDSSLSATGLSVTGNADDADLVILNTCHIREKAAEKVYSHIGRLIAQRKKDPHRRGRRQMIAIAGCVAQAEGAEILRRAPDVDLVIGPQSYHRLPQLLKKARGGARIVETGFEARQKFADLKRLYQGARTRALPAASRNESPGRMPPSAFLTIQEGCDKFCTFCVVPYTRGAEVSRSVEEIVGEAEMRAAAGLRELTLLGQNVNAYSGRAQDGGRWDLARLLHRLSTIPGLCRLRYTTSHPRDMSAALMAAHQRIDKLMPYLHLPVQSGSDRILTAMNRRHSADEYRKIIADMRTARPDIAISGDFIVGFPGEEEADFRHTLELVEEIGYASGFSFKYSPRPGTPAASNAGQIPEAISQNRLARLQDLLRSQQIAFNRARIGTQIDVLFERHGRKPGQLVGRSPWLQSVHADAPEECIGRLCPVEILTASQNSLGGRLAA